MRTIMKKFTPVLALLASVLCLSAVGADLTVDSGETETISGTATYGQILVNGTLNVADGANITVTRLMCGTNATGTAVFNLGKNAKLTVKGEDSNGLDCCFGYDTPCTATLDEGSLITTKYAEVAYLGTGAATVTLNNATITASKYFFLCRSSTDSSIDPKVWTAQVCLTGENACLTAFSFTRNQRASARILFDGGYAKSNGETTANWFNSNQNYAGATLACEGLNGNPVILEVSSGVATLFGCVNGPNAKVGVQGDCDLVIRGTFNGNLASASYMDGQFFTYTGKTIVQSAGLKMNKANELPADTDLEIASGAAVDLKGFPQTVASVTAEGTLKNTGASASLFLTSDTKASVISGLTDGLIGVVKEGSANLTVVTADGQAIDNLHVRKGEVKVCGRDRVGHRFYRFTPTARYGSNGETSVQYDELYLYDENGTDITGDRSGFTSGVKDDGGTTQPKLALDGDVKTKFYCYKVDLAWIALEFAEARKLSAYTFATGDDYGPIHKYKGNPDKKEPSTYDPTTCRDVSAWRLDCSDDGVTWWTLDEVTGFVPEDTRMYTYPKFEIGMSSAVTAFGTVMIDEGATLTLDGTTASFASLYRNGTLNGINGAKIVTGVGTSTVYGDGAFAGTIDVVGGTLRFGATGAVGPWFRLSITGNRDANNSVQLSELALYDAQGNRVNGNLAFNAKDKAATSLAAGEMTAIYGTAGGGEAPDKLTDGDLSTKGGLYVTTKPNPVTMRLAEAFASSKVFSYALASANDHAERDPASWTLEASADGTNWTVLDTRVQETVGDVRRSWMAYNGGQPYFTTNLTAGTTAFSPTATVKIGGGATLDLTCAASTAIGDLVVDYATGGTIRRFVPAAAGTLTVTGAPASWRELKLPLAVTDVEGAANLEGWTVTVNGRAFKGACAFVSDGFLCVRKSGLVIVVQ